MYGTPERNSCHLLNEYFTKYPEDASKVVLSIKGGLKKGEMAPDGSEKNIRRSIDDCLKALDGKKSIDVFECARVDPNTPIEVTIAAFQKCVDEGKIRGISLSEVKAETIRRASKVAPIACVEVELSLWATDILHNGVASTCAELGIPIVAYSPLMRGALTDQIKTLDDIPEGDFRRSLPKFQPDVIAANRKLTDEIDKLASRKDCTKPQIALAWCRALSGRPGMPTIIPIPGATTEARVLENGKEVELTEQDMKEIDEILKENEIVGDRYGVHGKALIEG